MKKVKYYCTDLGEMGLAEKNGLITNIFFEGTVRPQKFVVGDSPLLDEAGRRILEYLKGAKTVFDFPMGPEGTEFERDVWAALTTIPYGEVRTYRQIAVQIGRPQACRAVGRANGRNPITIAIPCHRVIGSDGRLTGYSAGLEFKERLLTLEGAMTGRLAGILDAAS